MSSDDLYRRRREDGAEMNKKMSERNKKMSCKIKRWLLAAIVLTSIVGFCDDAETVKVCGKGVGVTRMEALKDAYRDAIERAVGLYVDAEQMVKNEELVKDQILTQSNAYIEKYQIVIEGKSSNGLMALTILANVRKRDLTRKIKDIMPSANVPLSEVSKNLHAQIATELKANEDALSIIKNELKDLQPLKQLMRTSLATTKPVVEKVEEDSSLVRLWYPVKIEVDVQKYYNEFAPRWSRILNQIKIAPAKRLDLKNNSAYIKAYNDAVAKQFGTSRKNLTGVMTRCDEARERGWTGPLEEWGLALNEEYQGMAFLDTRVADKEYVLHGFGRIKSYLTGINKNDFYNEKCRIVERIFCVGKDHYRMQQQIDGECIFCVGLVTAASGPTLSGKLYTIPVDCANEIVRWQHRIVCGTNEGYEYRKSASEVECELKFVDASGNEVAGRAFALRNLEIMNIGCVLLEDTDYRRDHIGGKRLWLISPLVGGFAKSFVKWVSVDIPKDDVAKIATASISVEE